MNKKQLDNIPKTTGVYKFYDKQKNILYIGKALNLRARIQSYFRGTHFDRPHIIPMISLIEDIEVFETSNEIESLILESALIKKYKPKFNLELKDDKSYAWIFISLKEEYPRVSIVRSFRKGDYEKGELFGPYPKGKTIKSVFNYIRKIYPFRTCKNLKGPCLYYHLDLCPAPCFEKNLQKEYIKNINNLVKFLRGEKSSIIRNLERDMRKYAEKKDFEKAKVLRDKVNDLEYLSQEISVSPWDVTKETEYEKKQNLFKLLKKEFNLDKDIDRIECFDISYLAGQAAYGAMSVSLNFDLSTQDYRVFKIKKNKDSDIDMMKEVLERRLKLMNSDIEDASLNARPNLIILDGGKSHLNMLKNSIPKDISILGISKGKYLKKQKRKAVDELWLIKNQTVKKIDASSPTLFSRLRDEAHRFAIKYHKKGFRKSSRKSELDSIEGIGDKRRKILIKHFQTVTNIKGASLTELKKVLNNSKVAKKVYNYFHLQD